MYLVPMKFGLYLWDINNLVLQWTQGTYKDATVNYPVTLTTKVLWVHVNGRYNTVMGSAVDQTTLSSVRVLAHGNDGSGSGKSAFMYILICGY